MRNFFYTRLYTLLIICFTISACSQTATKSNNIQTINGRKFYLHKVEKSQSLYAISKLYEIDLNAIVFENPETADGIKVGQELKIPFDKIKNETAGTKELENFETHTVVKGETLYSICKKYAISEDSINALNPSLNGVIKEGQVLKIRAKKKNTADQSLQNPALVNQNYELYKVEKGETVYAISKKFNISMDDFYLWNPEAKSGVNAEQIVKVGLKKTAINPNQTIVNPNQAVIEDTLRGEKKPVYNVGLMLPFEFNGTDLINIDQLIKDRQDFPLTQTIAIELYEGIKYAIDSLQSADCKFNLQIFDTQDRDSAQIYKVIKDPSFRNLDICIGPVYNSSFKVTAESAKENGIPIISPLTQQNKILFENVYASKTTPSNFTLIEALAEFVADSFRNQNVVLINFGKTKEQAIIKAFKTHYNDYLYTHYSNTQDTIREVRDLPNAEGVKNIEKAKAAYQLSKKNYYVVISEDEISVSDFLTQLNNFIDKKKEITVIGLKKWVTMEYIDPEYLNKFQFLHPAPYFIDYSDSLINKAAKAYKAIYLTDPEDYYFQGIDIGLYYLNALKVYGTDFYKVLDVYKKNGMVMNFNFFRPSKTTGFDNKSIKMVRYKEYKYIKAD